MGRDDVTARSVRARLRGEQLYYESKLSLDTDGSALAPVDGTGQAKTSVKYLDGASIDANAVNYFVLPGDFWHSRGIGKGDFGVVVAGLRVA